MIITFAITASVASLGYLGYQRTLKGRTALPAQAPGSTTVNSFQTEVDHTLDARLDISSKIAKTLGPTMAWLTESSTDEGIDWGNSSPDYHKRGFVMSSISLGLAAVGTWIFLPLRYVAIPALAYMGIPAATKAGYSLIEEHRLTSSLIETGALILFLTQGYFIVGALGFCGYYMWGLYKDQTQQNGQPNLVKWQSPTNVRVRLGTHTATQPIGSVLAGDVIVIQSGEIIPLDGMITKGSAWVKQCLSDDTLEVQPAQIYKAGHRIAAKGIVLIGALQIQVERPAFDMHAEIA